MRNGMREVLYRQHKLILRPSDIVLQHSQQYLYAHQPLAARGIMLSSMQLVELKEELQAQSAKLNTLRGRLDNKKMAFLQAHNEPARASRESMLPKSASLLDDS